MFTSMVLEYTCCLPFRPLPASYKFADTSSKLLDALFVCCDHSYYEFRQLISKGSGMWKYEVLDILSHRPFLPGTFKEDLFVNTRTGSRKAAEYFIRSISISSFVMPGYLFRL